NDVIEASCIKSECLTASAQDTGKDRHGFPLSLYLIRRAHQSEAVLDWQSDPFRNRNRRFICCLDADLGSERDYGRACRAGSVAGVSVSRRCSWREAAS